MSFLPLESTADLSLPFLVGLLKAFAPTALVNIYWNGLNELCDLEIDKVSKSYRPVASGELSVKSGIVFISVVLIMSLAMGIMFQSPALLYGLLVLFFVGSAYSIELPLLRWKRHPFLAAMTMLILRGLVVQLAFFIHIQKYVLGRPIVLTRSWVFAIAFVFLFPIILALLKGIPDEDGDKENGIQTLSVSLGKEKVFWLAIGMLLMGYGSAMVVGASSSYFANKLVTVLGHGAQASYLWVRARSVDLDTKASIASFYMLIWKLYYAEYLLIQFVR